MYGIANETTFAKDQPEYKQLPAVRFDDGYVLTRWTLSWKERISLLLGGSVYLGILTFNNPLQPVKLTTDLSEVLE